MSNALPQGARDTTPILPESKATSDIEHDHMWADTQGESLNSPAILRVVQEDVFLSPEEARRTSGVHRPPRSPSLSPHTASQPSLPQHLSYAENLARKTTNSGTQVVDGKIGREATHCRLQSSVSSAGACPPSVSTPGISCVQILPERYSCQIFDGATEVQAGWFKSLDGVMRLGVGGGPHSQVNDQLILTDFSPSPVRWQRPTSNSDAMSHQMVEYVACPIAGFVEEERENDIVKQRC